MAIEEWKNKRMEKEWNGKDIQTFIKMILSCELQFTTNFSPLTLQGASSLKKKIGLRTL